MKLFKAGLIMLSTLSLCLLASCGGKKTTKKTTKGGTQTTKTNTSSTTKKGDSFDPEVAMNIFLANINTNNYRMASNRLTTNVCGNTLITLDYADEYSIDRAIMTGVGREVFEAKITDEGLSEVNFFKYGSSMEAATEQYRTLKIIPLIAQGNVWDIFTNIGDTGEYVTNSEEIKYMLAMIADYPKDFTGAMSQVTLTLDKTDDKKATFDATSTITGFETIHLEVWFGRAESNQYAEAWMENPVYPAAKTEWNDDDYGLFTALFYDDFDHCIPFVDGASYAFYADPNSIREGDALIIQDKHFTQESFEAYISKLETDGFIKEDERDGRRSYHKILRTDVKCYESILLDCTNGLYMEVYPYYKCDEYEEFDDIANIIKNTGFVELPNWGIPSYAIDGTGAQMDSTLYIHEYALVLDAEFYFANYADAKTALDEYVALLVEAGYIEKQPTMFEINEYYQTYDELFTVKYRLDDDILYMRFMAKKQYSLSDINGIICAKGFPSVPDEGYDYTYIYLVAKNDTNYDHYQSGYNYELSFDVRVAVETDDEAFYLILDVEHALVDTYEFEYDESLGVFVKGDLKVRIKQTTGENYTLVDIKYIVE